MSHILLKKATKLSYYLQHFLPRSGKRRFHSTLSVYREMWLRLKLSLSKNFSVVDNTYVNTTSETRKLTSGNQKVRKWSSLKYHGDFTRFHENMFLVSRVIRERRTDGQTTDPTSNTRIHGHYGTNLLYLLRGKWTINHLLGSGINVFKVRSLQVVISCHVVLKTSR